MPLASLFNLQWYGPASAAAVIQGTGAVTAQARGYARMLATLQGSGSISYARMVNLISAYATLQGTGQITTAQARGLLRMLATIKVNELSQDDVTGAVLEAKVDGNYTLKQVLRIIASAVAGKTSNTGQTFRDLSDTKDRITGTVSSGDRTAASYDAS